MLFDDATEEWYVQRDTLTVEWTENECLRQAWKFSQFVEKYSERFFPYMELQPVKNLYMHLQMYRLHKYYTSQIKGLHDKDTQNELEMNWLWWHCDYTANTCWGQSREKILMSIKHVTGDLKDRI